MAWCCMTGPRLSSPSSSSSSSSSSSWRLISSLSFHPLRTPPSPSSTFPLPLPLPLPLPYSVGRLSELRVVVSSKSISAAARPLCSSLGNHATKTEKEEEEEEEGGAEEEDDEDEDEDNEYDDDEEEVRVEEEEKSFQGSIHGGNRRFPPLSPREKKELRAYGHSLGKKIVSQQIGKAGVTPSLASAISDILEANEILKLKVLDNCPDELNEVIRKIEEATEGQVVGKIGSVITLYRPSLRKLSSVQKKKTLNPIQFARRR